MGGPRDHRPGDPIIGGRAKKWLIAFGLALEGVEGEQIPPEWLVSRVCEEFGCLPSQAISELEETPTGLIFEILELRAYVRIREAVNQAQRHEDIPDSPLLDIVWAVQEELVRRRRARRKSDDEG